MALNIRDAAVERMAAEVAELTGRRRHKPFGTPLEELRERLVKERSRSERGGRLARFLAHEAWPQIPDEVLGKPVTRAEREEVLGYGPEIV